MRKKFSFAINGRFLEQDLTGVQRFSEELTLRLLRANPDAVVVAPPQRRRLSGGLDDRVIETRAGAGHVWEQLVLPAWSARNGSPPLVNLASTAPLALKNQIVTHHDITYVRYPESFSGSFRALYRVLIPAMLRRNRAILTVSDFSRREIAEHYGVDPSKIHVIYNAVSEEFRAVEKDIADTQRPFFLAVSSKNIHKNFDYLLHEFADARSRGLNYDLKIVGGVARSFRQVEESTAHSSGVQWLGRVSDADLIALYGQASGFVFPSLYEGFGIPPLEAQAAGSPVLSSDLAALPEVLGDSALLADPRRAGAFADGMLRLASDPELRDDLRSRGAANVDRFSWERSADRILELIAGMRA